MQKIFIYLGEPLSPELAIDATDKEVIVIAPPLDVLLIEAALPKLSPSRLQQALPYALEEEVLTPIAELFFAIGHYQEDKQTYPVAVIEKIKLRRWLDILKAAGISPSYLIPAPLALPTAPHHWFVRLANNVASVRTGEHSGFACDIDNLATLLTLKKAEEAPDVIYLLTLETEPFLAETLGLTNLVLEKRISEKQFFSDAFSVLQKPTLNLLQGEFRPQQKTTENKKIWYWATAVTAAWLSVFLISNMLSFAILHHKNAQLETAIDLIYKRNFPNATRIVAPKQRMTEKLEALSGERQNNRALLLLAHLGKNLKKNSINIQQITYHNHQLRLDFSRAALSTIDNLSKALQQKGLTIKQENIESTGSQIKGALLISAGDSA